MSCFATGSLIIFLHSFFFFTAPATTEIYTLSLHDALPIYWLWARAARSSAARSRVLSASLPDSLSAIQNPTLGWSARNAPIDRKSTRLNSSHQIISYAVFCLKKKKKNKKHTLNTIPEH